MICLSGNENTPEKLINRIKANFGYINEVRLDLLDHIPEDFQKTLLPWKTKLIITHRSDNYLTSLNILEKFGELDFYLIDIELEKFLAETDFIENHFFNHQILLSYHGSASNLNILIDLLQKFRSYRFKFAVNANSVKEYENLMALSGVFPGSVLIATGKSGLFTRLRYRDYNSFMTYLSSSGDSYTDSGQIDLSMALHSRINIPGLKPVFLFGGKQILNSPGMKIYNRLFTESGMDLCYINHVCTEDFNPAEFLLYTKSPGASVTMPFKTVFKKFCHTLDISAEKAGGINTITCNNGFLTGYNTDFFAFNKIFSEIDFSEVIIAGNGATSRCAVSALKSSGFNGSVSIISRTTNVELLHPGKNCLFINTIPVQVQTKNHPFNYIETLTESILVDLDYTSDFKPEKYSRAITGMDFWKIQGSKQMSLISGQLIEPDDLIK